MLDENSRENGMETPPPQYAGIDIEKIPLESEQAGTKRRDRVTVPQLRERKAVGERLVFVTAYDAPSARLADRAGVDAVLVGDSVGPTVLGYDTTVPVTLDEIIHHTRAVRRGLRYALLIADLPFGSYQSGSEQAIESAVRLMKEGGAQGVKLEGGAPMIETTRRLVSVGIPVMGHLGLTPQSVHALGGHRAQGRDAQSAQQMLADARDLEAAGAFALVLEMIPAALAAEITAAVCIPTIGIGAGPECDGQVQVWHDLLGLGGSRVLRHTRRYAEIGTLIEAALRAYADDVRQHHFPTEEQSLP